MLYSFCSECGYVRACESLLVALLRNMCGGLTTRRSTLRVEPDPTSAGDEAE